MLRELTQDIQKLDDTEQLILSLRHTEKLAFTEISEILGLSTPRIYQLHSNALLKLRIKTEIKEKPYLYKI